MSTKYWVEYIDPVLGKMSDVWSLDTLYNEADKDEITITYFEPILAEFSSPQDKIKRKRCIKCIY